MIDWKKFDKQKLFKSRLVVISSGILIFALIALLVMAFLKNRDNKAKDNVPEAERKVVNIKTASESVGTEGLWRQTVQEQMETENKKIRGHLDNLAQNVENFKEAQETRDQHKMVGLESKLENINSQLQILKEESRQNIVEANKTKEVQAKNINQFTLGLENAQNSKDYKPIKTSDNYIPAGSFAKAVLLSGIDASTSLSANANPDPVLIRITDHGTLPRRFKSDLKDCHVIAAAYGDLSSERAKVRLEKLACTEIKTAEIIETEIVGFVAGEDGRQGLRGTVVSTEGKLLGNSLLSGVLGGLSGNFSSNNDRSISLFATKTKEPVSDKLKNSLAEGASSSLDRLSKYYIDRAESLQPIVQVGSGRKIDVIFTEGVFFGTTSLKKEIAKKRDEKIKDESRNTGLIRPLN